MTITVEQVIATLEEVVAEKGEDYVYPRRDLGCVYSDGAGSPSCIVGYVVKKLDPEKFSEFRQYEIDYGDSFGIEQAFRADDSIPQMEDWDQSTQKLLNNAQASQDNGKTWGEALTAAKAAL